MNEAASTDRCGDGHIQVTTVIPTEAERSEAQWRDLFCRCTEKEVPRLRFAPLGMTAGAQCFKFGISVSGTMRMPAASRPWRTAVDTVTAVGPSPCTQIESTWQGMRLPEVE